MELDTSDRVGIYEGVVFGLIQLVYWLWGC